MKIISATLVTFLALARAEEKGGQLRATERGLVTIADPAVPAIVQAVTGTTVCEWENYPSSTDMPVKLKVLGTFIYANGSDGTTKTPTVCLEYESPCLPANQLQVDGQQYFLADEKTEYATTNPVLGELDFFCNIIREGSSSGDPHIHTFTGKALDFMGGCDLVLLENPNFNNGQGISIHIRTKIRTWYSFIESAVVKIGNDTLEIKSGVEEVHYWVNGEAGDKKDVVSGGYLPFTIGGFPVRFRVPKDNVFQFRIFLNNDGQDVVIRSVKDFLRVDLKRADAESFSGSSGLMGDFSALDFLARDGETVLEDPNDYGKEWQVLSTEPMLFHDVEGVQHPEMCAMPDKELVEKRNRRRLGEGPVSRRAAEDACAKAEPNKLEDCIEDVIATGDLEYAMEYGAV